MRTLWALPLVLLLAACSLTACSTEFEPRAESDLYFSVWGALDATADTQWVRVAPIRASLDREAGPVGGEVSLVRLSDGRRWPMADSLIQLPGRRTVHGFWTTADVEPGGEYRVEIRRPDGAETRATVRVPPALPPVRLMDGICSCPSRATVSGTDNLIDAFAIYRDSVSGRTARFSKRTYIRRLESGQFTADVYYGDDALALGEDPFKLDRFVSEIEVVSATDAWPDGATLGFEESLRPLDGGRVENGVGFVGGVVTQRVRFRPGLGPCPTFGVTGRPCQFRPGSP